LGKFWRALEWKRLVYSMAIWNVVWPFGSYLLWSFGNLMAIWYIFPRFGILCRKIWQPCRGGRQCSWHKNQLTGSKFHQTGNEKSAPGISARSKQPVSAYTLVAILHMYLTYYRALMEGFKKLLHYEASEVRLCPSPGSNPAGVEGFLHLLKTIKMQKYKMKTFMKTYYIHT
jgi:hypothetical protein